MPVEHHDGAGLEDGGLHGDDGLAAPVVFPVCPRAAYRRAPLLAGRGRVPTPPLVPGGAILPRLSGVEVDRGWPQRMEEW